MDRIALNIEAVESVQRMADMAQYPSIDYALYL